MEEKENVKMVEEMEERVVEKPKAKKTTTKKKTTKPQPKKKTKAELRKILKDSEAVIVNNFGVKLRYEDNNGFELELLSYGDTDVVEIEELRKMHVKKKAFFNNYWILITDVICDDESVTLEDVYEYIGITKLYKEFENPNNEFFEDLLIDSSLDEFKNVLNHMNKELITQLFVRATELYKQQEFRDSLKIMSLEEKVGREDCFKDIKIED